MRAPVVAAVWAASSMACTTTVADTPVEEVPCKDAAADVLESCLTEHYLAKSAGGSLAPCTDAQQSKKTIGGRQEVAFFRSPSTSDADVVKEGGFLQSYYAPYELTFFTRSPASEVAFSYALQGSNDEFNARAQELGGDDAALKKAVADIMFGGLRQFITEQSNPPVSRVNVVVLEQIASPDVAKSLGDGKTIGGLGLSPALFEKLAANDSSRALFDQLALPDDFTPTLFIGHDDIVSRAANPQQVVAHEMGHALGLQHTTGPGLLMTQGQSGRDCRSVMTDAEVEQLKTTASALMANETDMLETFRVVAEAHRRVVANVRRR